MANNKLDADVESMFASLHLDQKEVDNVLKGPDMAREPLFTADDIPKARNRLMRFLVFYFAKHHITEEDMKRSHRNYCRKKGFSESSISTRYNNLMKPLKRSGDWTITFNKFLAIFEALELTLIEEVRTFKSEVTGDVESYSDYDIDAYCKQHVSDNRPKLAEIHYEDDD